MLTQRRRHDLACATVTAALAWGALACSSASETEGTGESSSSETSTATTTDETSTATGTETSGEPEPEPPLPETSECEPDDPALLFGTPTDNTGLGPEQCQSSCACAGGPWTPPSYDEAFVAAIESLELLDPPGLLDDDPYAVDPEAEPEAGSVCALVFEADNPAAYRLETFGDELSAVEAGAWITHQGACGQCSSLANLAVYIRRPDLTEPVRACGLDGIVDGEQANIECLMELGFDEPCAQIWYYNTAHTREVCFDICIAELDNPNHLPDGSLNPCIQCDEDESGAVFKTYSGRTRRNSGLPSALCRPCDSVYRVVHDYGLR